VAKQCREIPQGARRAGRTISPVQSLAVREEAGKIVLEKGSLTVIIPVLPHDQDIPYKGFQPAEVLSGIRAIRSTESESSGLAREIRADRETESFAR
jgi:hypothetical protein